MSIDCFDVATTGDDERRLANQAQRDKIAAATYDVREKHGEWLFGAPSREAFSDRVALCYNSIAKTIDATLPARTGSIKKVIKNIEAEWRQRQAAGEHPADTLGRELLFDPSVGGDTADAGPQEGRHEYYGPGHPQNKNHPMRQAAGNDPYDGRGELGGNEYDPHAQRGGDGDHHAPYEPEFDSSVINDGARSSDAYEDDPEDEDWLRKNSGDPEQWDRNKTSRRRQASEDGAYERSQPDHPEQNIKQTYQPHTGEDLIPTKDWDGYRDRVSQGGPGKVDSHDFIPGAHTDRHDETNGEQFVTSSRELQVLARMLHADDTTGNDPNAMGNAMGGMPGGGGMAPAAPAGGPGGGIQAPTPPSMGGGGAAPAAPGAAPIPGAAPPVTASREYLAMRRMLADASGVSDYNSAMGIEGVTPKSPGVGDPTGGTLGETAMPGQHPMGTIPGKGGTGTTPLPGPNDAVGGPRAVASREASRAYFSMQAVHNPPGHAWAMKAIRESGSIGARQRLMVALYEGGMVSDRNYQIIANALGNRRRVADRNYLQQADEAITKVLNEKAEEFQNTIAPLQQALVTIQQAEQLQSPLNVQSPAGTVNVLPGGGQDPNAAAGGQPAPQGGPAAAGGAPQADPSAAAGLAGQPQQQQMQASRHPNNWLTAGAHDFSDHHDQLVEDEMREFGDPGPVRAKQPPQHYPDWDGSNGAMAQELGEPGPGRHRARRRQAYDQDKSWGGDPDFRNVGKPSQCEQCGGKDGQHAHYCDVGGDNAYRNASRGRRPLDRRQRRADVVQQFQEEQAKAPGLPTGGPSDIEPFIQKNKVGPRAQQKLRQNLGLPDGPNTPNSPQQSVVPKQRRVKAPGAGSYGLAASRRQGGSEVEPGYVWSKAPVSVKGEFANRVGSGVSADEAFRGMIAEIAEHHRQGKIGENDAHRAANEALGRLMLSRRRRAEKGDFGGKKAKPFGSKDDDGDDDQDEKPWHEARRGARGRRPLA